MKFDELEQELKKRKEKWCHICGRRVDLRQGYTLPNMLQINETIRNKDYWYIHRKCYDKVKGQRII